MITAYEAQKISIRNNLDFIDKKIKEAAENGQRQISLLSDIHKKLSPQEKRILQDNGFKVSEGHSGKGGEFDIISW